VTRSRELGPSGNLLREKDGTEARVEGTNTLILQNLAEASDQTVGKGRLGDETDTGSLERAESDIGEELSESRGGEVDGSAVLRGGLIAEIVDALLLEELISSELESALEEVSGGGGTETSPHGTGTLILNDLLESSDKTFVVLDRVELNSGLDAVGTMLACAIEKVISKARHSKSGRAACH
jgi:hypothetical protein